MSDICVPHIMCFEACTIIYIQTRKAYNHAGLKPIGTAYKTRCTSIATANSKGLAVLYSNVSDTDNSTICVITRVSIIVGISSSNK
jgi:hypothetical protein